MPCSRTGGGRSPPPQGPGLLIAAAAAQVKPHPARLVQLLPKAEGKLLPRFAPGRGVEGPHPLPAKIQQDAAGDGTALRRLHPAPPQVGGGLGEQPVIRPLGRDQAAPAPGSKLGTLPALGPAAAVKILQKMGVTAGGLPGVGGADVIPPAAVAPGRHPVPPAEFRPEGEPPIPAVPHLIHQPLVVEVEGQRHRPPPLQGVLLIPVPAMTGGGGPLAQPLPVQPGLIAVVGAEPEHALPRRQLHPSPHQHMEVLGPARLGRPLLPLPAEHIRRPDISP